MFIGVRFYYRHYSEMPTTSSTSDDSLSLGDDLDIAVSHQDILAGGGAAVAPGGNIVQDHPGQIQHVPSDPYEMLMNMAVKGFQQELDIHDNVEFLRDR